MMRKAYAPIDLLSRDAPAWPADVPELTDAEAVRAVRRLWRFAMGATLAVEVICTSGNRHTWMRHGRMYVNASKGWRDLIHSLSHLFVTRANPGERPHSKFHARFEAKLIREVIRRGWLDGALRDKPKAAIEPAAPSLDDKRRDKLARLYARAQAWEKKLARAERALAKIRKQARYYEKALGVE